MSRGALTDYAGGAAFLVFSVAAAVLWSIIAGSVQ